jgi:hypothetical protein
MHCNLRQLFSETLLPSSWSKGTEAAQQAELYMLLTSWWLYPENESNMLFL